MDESDFTIAPLDNPDPAATTQPHAPFAARLGRRGQALRVGGIVGVVLLAALVLVAVTPGARSAVAGVVFEPTPTATVALTLGQDRFGVEDQVPWGTLTIDGRPGPKIPTPPLATGGNPPQWQTFTLPRGHHQLAYQADPFPTLRCTVSVPAARSDTCPLNTSFSFQEYPTDFPDQRVLDLRASVDRLPAAEALRLTDVTQQVLNLIAGHATATLEPGDHYVDQAGVVQVADEALVGVPTYALVSEETTNQGEGCAGLCSTSSPFAQYDADNWLVYGVPTVTWQYTAADGEVLVAKGRPTPASLDAASAITQVSVQRVGGSWQVRLAPPVATNTQLQDLPLCSVGSLYLDTLRANSGGTVGQWPESSALPTLGCLFAGGTTDDQGNLTGTPALVLYRCGVLVAVNDQAERLLQELPVASPNERALALAAWPPTPATEGPGA